METALLWMQVAPSSTNLVAHALCRDAEALHHDLTRCVALDAITRIETAPVLRTCKAAATLCS